MTSATTHQNGWRHLQAALLTDLMAVRRAVGRIGTQESRKRGIQPRLRQIISPVTHAMTGTCNLASRILAVCRESGLIRAAPP
jgi:hypothetical protein